MVPQDFRKLSAMIIVDDLALAVESGIQPFDISCYFAEGEKFTVMEGWF